MEAVQPAAQAARRADQPRRAGHRELAGPQPAGNPRRRQRPDPPGPERHPAAGRQRPGAQRADHRDGRHPGRLHRHQPRGPEQQLRRVDDAPAQRLGHARHDHAGLRGAQPPDHPRHVRAALRGLQQAGQRHAEGRGTARQSRPRQRLPAGAAAPARLQHPLPAGRRAAFHGQGQGHAGDGLRQDPGPRLVQEHAVPGIRLGHGRQVVLRRRAGLRRRTAPGEETVDAHPADRGHPPALLGHSGIPGQVRHSARSGRCLPG
ncbi:hypothetical protein D3C76_857290 [compost metagenome]